MYSNLVISRQWNRITCLCKYSTSLESQKLPQVGKSVDGISPPPKIHRESTDILQALAATVGLDPTAAHYKYHDDPFLIPLSNYRKRAYALSAEAGRKAAAWVRDEHAEWFNTRVWDPPGKKKTPHFNADPQIPAYAPKPIYNDESKVTVDDLKYTIDNALVEDAIKVYQLLGGDEGISEELKMQFLQLLCFYNELDAGSMEWLEERWFSTVTRDRQIATWKRSGIAEHIFTSMEEKTPEAYCCIIQGMAKYYQAERAHELVKEALEKGIPLSTSVYNSLIVSIGFLYEGAALRIEQLHATLKKMVELGLSPNAGTLTACLRSLSVWGSGRILQQTALELLADFKTMGIHPGLSCYYYLLCLFCKEKGPRTDILSSILRDLESRPTLEASDPVDTKFFITAMAVCSDHLEDMDMAERVHALLMKGDNYKLVGDAYKESIYYRHLVTIACKRAPLEKVTQLLDELVPNVYVPEPSVMEKIIELYETGGVGDRLAQTWSQLVIFGLAKRTNLLEKLLNAMTSCYDFQDPDVKEKMCNAALDVLKFGQKVEEEMEGQSRRTPPQRLSASALCNVIELCSADATQTSECWTWISEALQQLHSGEAAGAPPKPSSLVKLANKAASLGQNTIAATAISYLAEYGFEEATTASVQVLGVLLNRPGDEIQALLKKPRSDIALNLDPSSLAIVDAYLMSSRSTEEPRSSSRAQTSDSESDSESSDDERRK